MKYNLKKTLQIECTLDSSEAIMFTKGGKHCLKLENDDEDCSLHLDSFDLIEISFQIEKSQQGRFDHIDSEAKKHRGMWDEINAQSKEEAKKRMDAYAEQVNSLKPKPPTSEASSTP